MSDQNKNTFKALVSAKDRLHDVLRQEFIGGKLSLKDKTYTTRNGRFQLALLESGDVVRRSRVS